MERQQPDPARPTSYGVDAELDRLLRCPACGSGAVRPVLGGYGLLGLKALGDFGSPRDVHCRNCGHEWSRAPMRELRREAQRRIDARYDALDVENGRLRRQLEDFLAANPPSTGAGRPSPAAGEAPEPGT